MASEASLNSFEPILRYAIRRVRDVIVRYAQSKAWSPQDYYIFMVINKKWRTISVEMISNHFEREKIESFEYLIEVMDYLKQDLRDETEIYRSLGLVLGRIDGFGFFENRSYGEDMVEVDDEYLNPGKPSLRVAPSPTHS